MSASDALDLVIVGRLRRSHGVKGDIITEAITDAPAAVFAAGRRLYAGTADGDPDPKGAMLTVARSEARFDGSWLVAFKEITSPEAAAKYHARYVLLPRGELAPPGEGDAYLHELPGMTVVLESGEELGLVTEVYELPAGLTLDISYKSQSVMLPYVFVNRVDRAARVITAAPPQGMFE